MYSLRLDGAETILWEPLWHLQVHLSPVERALLATSPLRRLHHLAHNGSSSILTGHTQSRLQHTLGVFALIAHFQPDNVALRVAALLHDIGHYPFSHTLEQLPHVDHRPLTLKRLRAAPIAPLLQTYDLDLEAIILLVEGDIPSPLRNKENTLHADHLDSWVRGAQARGQLGSGADVLKRLKLADSHIETDEATAEYLVELIVAEAQFHASAANLGSSALVSQLVSSLLEAQVISLDRLAEMTDIELSHHLLNAPQTSAQAQKLWFGSDTLAFSRELEKTNGIPVNIDKFYLSLPRVRGRPADSPKIRERLASVERLRGEYVVYWKSS